MEEPGDTQELFVTPRHLAVCMEYTAGEDSSQFVDSCKRAGVRPNSTHELLQILD